MSFLTILVERKEYAIWFARSRSRKEAIGQKKNHVREILTPEDWQANMKKLLIALTFLLGCVRWTPAAWVTSSVDRGASTGTSAGLGRHLHLYFIRQFVKLEDAQISLKGIL